MLTRWIALSLVTSLVIPAGAVSAAPAFEQGNEGVEHTQSAPPTTERRWRESLDRRQVPPGHPFTCPHGHDGYGHCMGETGKRQAYGQTELWVVPPADQTVFVYDQKGTLLSIMDRRGTIVLPSGQNIRIVLKAGRTTVWNGDIAATPGYLEVRFSDTGAPRIFRAPPPQRAEGRPLPNASFQYLLRALDSYEDDADRLAFVQAAIAPNVLSTNQAGEVLRRFGDEESRLLALAAIEGSIADRNNAGDLTDFFWTHQGRRRASAILRL